MNLTLEVYRDIVRYTGNRADIASLCRVSRAFQHVAQRALYNTLYVRTVDDTLSVCTAIATNPRLAEFVDALTVFYPDPGPESDSDDETSSLVDEAQVEVPPDYWSLVSRALQSTTRLRFLNIHVNDYEQRNVAWILDGCTFRLRHFHCDLDWDPHLVAFLNTQTDLNDLYLIDYNESRKTDHDSHTVDDTNASGSEPLSAPTLNNPEPADSPLSPKAADVKGKLALNSTSLPSLSTLECTFSEAAISIVPGRPVTRLKTCFSSSTLPQKRAEMALLFSKLKLSSRSLHSLDLSDSEYSESFAMEMLRAVVQSKAMTRSLRYLGTLVLPIMGKERLQFYGLLMRLPRITCIELDVSEWDPPPISPPAFRALASELRIYIPNITRVIFVHEYERTAVRAMPDGMCRVEPDVNWEFIWREV